MKKMIVLGALILAPLVTMAADICSGTAGPGTAIASSTTDFVKVGFTPVCSAETLVSVAQDAVGLWGGSASKKGKYPFAGSTKGGAVKPLSDIPCASTGCVASNVTSAVTVAAGLGS